MIAKALDDIALLLARSLAQSETQHDAITAHLANILDAVGRTNELLERVDDRGEPGEPITFQTMVVPDPSTQRTTAQPWFHQRQHGTRAGWALVHARTGVAFEVGDRFLAAGLALILQGNIGEGMQALTNFAKGVDESSGEFQG